ncbi:MAG: DNA mismatch repair endonuclease MutL, partial [Oscillibacter sp.]|nr:DNA mismatch repair endonuclease MutL [Oscillibacter sp.]
MAHIQVLDDHIAELIAAGEVVERPASVVKELVENAIDAQSTNIQVSIERGGMRSISVSDNGIGIAPEELPSAFLRHATSKIRSADDLGAIATLGFRGEALAAICAVSRVDIRTRQRGADMGARLELEGGVGGDVEECGAPEGTVITVRDLFYNTPARLKFMRKDSAETAAINGLVQHLALSRPDIAFRFDKDGAAAFRTPGDGKLLSAIYAAYGRDFARSLLSVDGRGGEIAVSGYVTFPAFGRGSRAMQMFFLNGRFIKSPLLTTALEEAYKNQMLKGKFPGCVLSITMPPYLVDVNAHPAKTEVKFSNERDLFRTVYHIVLDNLNAHGGPTNVSLSDGAQAGRVTAQNFTQSGRGTAQSGFTSGRAAPQVSAQSGRAGQSKPDFFRNMDAKTYREALSNVGAGQTTVNRFADADDGFSVRLEAAPAARPPMISAPPDFDSDAPRHSDADAPPETSVNYAPDALLSPPGTGGDVAQRQRGEQFPAPDGQGDLLPTPRVRPWRIAGEILRTYIICESADGDVFLIDKHAVHERIRFDALKSGVTPPMRQTLMQPLTVELSREDMALAREKLEELERLGFDCEDFGGNTLLVRELPADMNPGDLTAVMEELVENLRAGRDPEEKREAMFRTMACKSAIRGGEETSPRELRALIDRVQSGEVRYCPHGRPVAAKFSKLD